MDIHLLQGVTVAHLVDKYHDAGEGGVTGYGGNLDIRPPFQREFIYEEEQQMAVIRSIQKGYPLNSMYWVERDDGMLEVMDGQQRTISIARYVNNRLSVNDDNGQAKYFNNLSEEAKEKIMEYPLMIYKCSGSHDDKLEWFRTINIAGKELTRQEMRNAIYAGTWVTDAKRHFSRVSGPSMKKGSRYLNGHVIRQEHLETAIRWDCGSRKPEDISAYMALHQNDASANALWQNFSKVIDWVESVFRKYRPQMKGRDWGRLYREHGNRDHDPDHMEQETIRLMMDDEVQSRQGIYEYLLTGNEKHLALKKFPDAVKTQIYTKQRGKCKICKKKFPESEMEGDHIKPWSQGGKTISSNCQMLCKPCNQTKGGKW